jgi:hypothetical protein
MSPRTDVPARPGASSAKLTIFASIENLCPTKCRENVVSYADSWARRKLMQKSSVIYDREQWFKESIETGEE